MTINFDKGKDFNYGWICGHYVNGLWWFRIYGYGINWKDVRKHKPLFSERNGYRKHLRIGYWSFGWVKPDKISTTQDIRGISRPGFTLKDLEDVADRLNRMKPEKTPLIRRYCNKTGFIEESIDMINICKEKDCQSCRQIENYCDE